MTRKNTRAKNSTPSLILRGVHLWLTPAIKSAISQKAERLFRHEPHIIRVRVDVARDHRRSIHTFTAKGHVEMPGPDLTAAVVNGDAYQAVNLLIDKLDRMLRRRTTAVLRRRTTDDIRTHATPAG